LPELGEWGGDFFFRVSQGEKDHSEEIRRTGFSPLRRKRGGSWLVLLRAFRQRNTERGTPSFSRKLRRGGRKKKRNQTKGGKERDEKS